MYRKIFRAISPTFHQKSPLYLLLKRDLQHFLSARFCNNLGLVLNPSSRPFMTSASGAIRGYQEREKAVCVNLQSPVWWKLCEWKQQSWSVGPPLFNGKISAWENQPVEWIQHQKNQGIRNSSFGMALLGLFRWVAAAFNIGSQPGHLHLCRASCDLERILGSRDLGWFGISHEVDSFLVLFFSTFSAMAWNWTSSLRKKIHRSLVHGFCLDGSTLIGSAFWERNILTATLPIDWINTRETDDRI